MSSRSTRFPLLATLALAGCSAPTSAPNTDAGVISSPVARVTQTTGNDALAAFNAASAIAGRGESWLGSVLARHEEGLRADGDRFVARGRHGVGAADGDIDVTAAADAREGLTIGVGGARRFDMKVALVGADGVRGASVDARVGWTNVFASTDALLVAGARFTEYALLLRDAQAPRSFTYAVTRPKGIVTMRRSDRNEILFDDSRGEPVFRMQAPFVVDGRGEKRAAMVTVHDDSFEISFDPTGLTYPVVVDPTMDIPTLYQEEITKPSAPEGPVAVTKGSQIWSITGSTPSGGFVNGGEVYTPGAFIPWSSIAGGIPTGRRYAAGSIIKRTGAIAVVGGWDGGGPTNNWASYTGSSWTDRGALIVGGLAQPGRVGAGATAVSYPVGALGALVDQIVVWGGNNYTTVYSDLFTWDGGSGSGFLRQTVTGETPLKRSHMVFTSNGGSRVFMAAGTDSVGGRYSDTWSLLFYQPTVSSPIAAVWSPICGAGGKKACPFVARTLPASAFDEARQRVIMVGGDAASGKLNDIWELDTNPSLPEPTWTAICGGSLPTCHADFVGRGSSSMTCLPNSDGTTKCFILGGTTASGALRQMWSYRVRGNACATAADCDTGSCIDGVCCEDKTACGSCRACNVAGSIGRCANVTAGDTHTTCSGVNACNGVGGCVLTQGQACSAGAQCLSGFCADGYCCNTACGGACDACAVSKGAATNGTCKILAAGAAGDPACGTVVCNGSSATCPGGCARDADCSSSSYCAVDGKCKPKKALGATCSPAAECIGGACGLCASGSCVDGVCCDRACDGLCEACSKDRKGTTVQDGRCGFAADGEGDRAGRCTDSGTGDGGCKTDGKCSGAGACRYYSKTTSCGSTGATCVGNSASGKFCDGTGTCAAAGGTKDCGAIKCKAGAGCPATCASDADCIDSAFCDATTNVCKPKSTIGITCGAGRECASGLCIDGNCCERPCDNQCEACDVKGAEGKCAPVIGAPHGTRMACGAGPDGKPCEAPSCDGTVRDKCIGRPGADIVCAEESCTGNIEQPLGYCDGKGVCAASAPRPCKPFICGVKACKSKCETNADCQSPATCDTVSGECIVSGKCEPDGFTLVSPDGTTKTDCRPFICDSSGRCKDTCTVSTDCFAPNVCDVGTSKCVAPPGTGDDGGGCTTGRGRNTTFIAFAFAAALGLIARRRRLSSRASE